MVKRLTRDFVAKEFAKRGYTLLSKEYVNSQKKLDYRCPNGHKRSMTWGDFQQGGGCKECAGQIITYSRVKAAFEARGYTLLSKEYVNNRKKLDCRCPKGHERSVGWEHFQQGRGCKKCAGQTTLTYNHVKTAFEERGYTLLSKKYVNNHGKLDYRCLKGHERSICWRDFQGGTGCKECAGQIVTHDYVKNAFEARGYTLLSREYKSNAKKLDYLCPNGHERSISWSSFQQGKGCKDCAGQIVTYSQVKAAFNAMGYTLLSKEYVNSSKKLNYWCPKGHEHAMSWGSFQRGNGCAVCAGQIVTHDQVKTAFEARGYTLLSPYQRADDKLKYLCPSGHENHMAWANFQRGSGCSLCNPGGFNPKNPGILYYVRFRPPSGFLYKIGITNNSIKNRFRDEKTPFKTIESWAFEIGQEAYDREQELLKKFSYARYRGPDVLTVGNTELFTDDVLMLDQP